MSYSASRFFFIKNNYSGTHGHPLNTDGHSLLWTVLLVQHPVHFLKINPLNKVTVTRTLSGPNGVCNNEV